VKKISAKITANLYSPLPYLGSNSVNFPEQTKSSLKISETIGLLSLTFVSVGNYFCFFSL
jgi:hypothetical protein